MLKVISSEEPQTLKLSVLCTAGKMDVSVQIGDHQESNSWTDSSLGGGNPVLACMKVMGWLEKSIHGHQIDNLEFESNLSAFHHEIFEGAARTLLELPLVA